MADAATVEGTSDRSRMPLNLMDSSSSPMKKDPNDIPLQPRMVARLRWTDAGDRLGIRIQRSEEDCYLLDKKTACSESAYIHSCYTSSKDRYPDTTARLMHLSSNDQLAYGLILEWLSICPHIRDSLNEAALIEPEIFIKNWCEEWSGVSFKEWCHVYTLAEALKISRLEEHIRVAVELKAVATKRLPPYNAIEYLYLDASRFCGLKDVFLDMYGVAAAKTKDVFGADRDLYPEQFLRDVDTYLDSRSEAYIERRWALKGCVRPPLGLPEDDRDEDDE